MKKDTPLEKDIQREICDWLAFHSYFFWRSNNIPVFGRSNDGVRRFRALPKYTPRGLPDIMVIFHGKFIAIEVKRAGAKLRPEQVDFCQRVIENKGEYITVHSLMELKLCMESLKYVKNDEKTV